MKTIFLGLGLTIATIAPSFAANAHAVYGTGFEHCSVTNKLAKNVPGQLVIASFVSGYISAMNAFSDQKESPTEHHWTILFQRF